MKKTTSPCSTIASLPDDLIKSAKDLSLATGKNSQMEYIARIPGMEDVKFFDDKAYIQRLANTFDPNQKYTAEELVIIDNFRNLMGYVDSQSRPGWFVNNFLKYWHGSIQKNQGVSIGTEQATLYDLRMFMEMHRQGRDYIWNVMNTGENGRFLSKYFAWFPDTIAKQNKSFDYQLKRTIAYVKDYEGNVQKVFAVTPTTTMGQLHEMASSVNDMISGMQDYRVVKINEDLEILSKVNSITGNAVDADVIFDYAVARRELRAPIGDRDVFQAEYDAAKKRFDDLGDKEYTITEVVDGQSRPKAIKASEVADIVDQKLTDHLNDFYQTFVVGNMPEDTIVFLEPEISGARSIRLIDVEKTFQRINAATKQTQDASSMVVGINNLGMLNYQRRLQKLAKQLQQNGDTRDFADIVEALHGVNKKYNLEYKDIGFVGGDSYFPHLNHPDKYVEDFVRKNLEREMDEKNIVDEVERLKFMARSEQNISRSHQNWVDDMLWKSQSEFITTEESYENIAKSVGLHNRQKNMRKRGENATIAGWQRDVRSLKQYERDVVKGYYNNLLALAGDIRIDNFRENVKGKIDDADVRKWAKFMEVYVRDNLGYPSVYSEADIRDLPEIKKSFYWHFTDQYVSEQGGKFLSKLRKTPKKEGDLEDPTANFNATQWLQTWSNFEAKYQLMTLLSRPKTFINNIVGGEPNTLISVGFRHWRGTQDLAFLKSRIDPRFNSFDDVYRWAESHGALESFLANEISNIDKVGSAQVKDAINRMANVVKGNPDVKDMELMEIWRKSGLSDAVFDKFAFFMKRSERQLRYRSFVSHYLKAREIFDVSGSMIDPNDPLLISMARKGVAATQFMYNNANRPAFSRTSLGKVFSRFQLWAWNSTKFRAQIFNDMKQYGVNPNTDQGKKFERLILADMMMLALASLLPFSIFESVLPQPIAWLRDTAQWLFGDEEERESAFMGALPVAVAPLQLVLPPSARFITPIIGSLFSGDWERMGSYYAYTYAPYGLLVRDISMSIETPINTPQNMIGIPLVQLGRLKAKADKTDEVGWGPLFRTVPKEEETVDVE
jgi:hypothetical protein